MAVVNKFTNADLEAGKKAEPALTSGAERKGAIQAFEVANGDSNNSVYKVFANLNPDIRPTAILISNDAFGTSGACHVGLYDAETGDAVDEDCFAASLSLVSAGKRADGMAAVGVEDFGKMLWELAGDTLATKKSSYMIGIKVTNVGANATGTIAAELEYLH